MIHTVEYYYTPHNPCIYVIYHISRKKMICRYDTLWYAQKNWKRRVFVDHVDQTPRRPLPSLFLFCHGPTSIVRGLIKYVLYRILGRQSDSQSCSHFRVLYSIYASFVPNLLSLREPSEKKASSYLMLNDYHGLCIWLHTMIIPPNTWGRRPRRHDGFSHDRPDSTSRPSCLDFESSVY